MDTQKHTATKIKIHIETQADTQNFMKLIISLKLPPKCVCSFSAKSETKDQLCKVFFCFFFLCKKRCLPIWRNEIEASMKYEPGGHTCPVVEEFTHLWFEVHARSVRVMAPSLQCTPSNSPATCYLALLVPVTLVFGPRWHHEFAKPV